MKVRSFLAYPSYDRDSDADWMAYNVTMALKGAQFKGYCDIKIDGVKHTITANNTRPILGVFGKRVVASLGDTKPGTAIFVLPSSGCVAFGQDPKAARLADAIRAAKPPIPVATPFRWIETMPKAAGGGGPRDPDVLRRKMRFSPCPGIEHALLVDDVKTTGGHLRAASRLLRDHGVATVGAICFARTVWEKPERLIEEIVELIGD